MHKVALFVMFTLLSCDCRGKWHCGDGRDESREREKSLCLVMAESEVALSGDGRDEREKSLYLVIAKMRERSHTVR